jgi:hypothetical protein
MDVDSLTVCRLSSNDKPSRFTAHCLRFPTRRLFVDETPHLVGVSSTKRRLVGEGRKSGNPAPDDAEGRIHVIGGGKIEGSGSGGAVDLRFTPADQGIVVAIGVFP